jgi:hypothetical protein
MIIVEVIFRGTDQGFVSHPIEATKEEFVSALETEKSIDFPFELEAGGSATFCISTEQINQHCYLIFREVE